MRRFRIARSLEWHPDAFVVALWLDVLARSLAEESGDRVDSAGFVDSHHHVVVHGVASYHLRLGHEVVVAHEGRRVLLQRLRKPSKARGHVDATVLEDVG